jgi:hypothetical protein
LLEKTCGEVTADLAASLFPESDLVRGDPLVLAAFDIDLI